MNSSDDVEINSVNTLYSVVNEVDEFTEEINGNKHSTLVSTDRNKEVLTKYTELWNDIKKRFHLKNI